ncbi:hypothetical protein HMPREF1450_01636 [Helicobacter pylori HP260ASii]|nr:hypothetical protein HMPREF1450_01636 [Helicobacter pylori HP260ASii]
MAHTNQTIFRTLHALTLLPIISPTIFSVAFDFFKKAHFFFLLFLKFFHSSKFLLIVGKNVNRS